MEENYVSFELLHKGGITKTKTSGNPKRHCIN